MDAEDFLNYLCDLCNKTYKKESALDSHLLKYHKVKSDKQANQKTDSGEGVKDEKDEEAMETDQNPIENEDNYEDENEEQDNGDVDTTGFEDEFENVKVEEEFENESTIDKDNDTFDNTSEKISVDAEDSKDPTLLKTIKSEKTVDIKTEATPDTKTQLSLGLQEVRHKYGIVSKNEQDSISLDSSYYARSPAGEYSCKSCGKVYRHRQGIRHHYKMYTCGIGQKEYTPSMEKKDFMGMYTKNEDGSLSCNSCETKYNSGHGVYSHLKTTLCGDGDRERRNPKIDWKSFWTRVDESTISCVKCCSVFNDLRGIHNHLKKTDCGAGAKAKEFVPNEPDYTPEMSKRVFVGLFSKDGDLYCCNNCSSQYSSPRGVKHHLQKTTCGFGSKEFIPTSKRDFSGMYMKTDEWIICTGCSAKYTSNTGIKHHLNNTNCGFGTKEFSPNKAGKDYYGMYMKTDDGMICNGCSSKYNSLSGIKFHLNNTNCGFGHKEATPNKSKCKDYTSMYMKTGDDFICNGCGSKYSSHPGIHFHLRNTNCGFGDKAAPAQRLKKDYQSKYIKDGDSVFCTTCGAKYPSVRGMHHHLNNTTCGFGERDPSLIARQMDRKERNSSFSEAKPFIIDPMNIKTETEGLSCLACGKSFDQLSNLREHLKTSRDCAEAIGLGIQQLQVKREKPKSKENDVKLPENIKQGGEENVKEEPTEIQQQSQKENPQQLQQEKVDPKQSPQEEMDKSQQTHTKKENPKQSPQEEMDKSQQTHTKKENTKQSPQEEMDKSQQTQKEMEQLQQSQHKTDKELHKKLEHKYQQIPDVEMYQEMENLADMDIDSLSFLDDL